MPNPVPGPGQDVLPGPDADFDVFAVGFAPTWNPADANATAPLSADLVTEAASFTSLLQQATDPATRTPVLIAAKDSQRASLSSSLRDAIRLAVAAFRAGVMSAAQLALLGIRVPDLSPTPVGVPIDAPLLGLNRVTLGVIGLRVTQVSEGVPVNTRAFPLNYAGVELSIAVGGVWSHRRLFKRVNIFEDVSDLANGTTVQCRVRYATNTGLTGPWSDPVSAAVLLGV